MDQKTEEYRRLVQSLETFASKIVPQIIGDRHITLKNDTVSEKVYGNYKHLYINGTISNGSCFYDNLQPMNIWVRIDQKKGDIQHAIFIGNPRCEAFYTYDNTIFGSGNYVTYVHKILKSSTLDKGSSAIPDKTPESILTDDVIKSGTVTVIV